MTALKVIGIILLIFLLIGFLRVGALLRFGQELNLRLSVGPFRFTLLPAKEKKETAQEAAKPKKEEEKRTEKKKRGLPKLTKEEKKDLISTALSALEARLQAPSYRPAGDSCRLWRQRPGGDRADLWLCKRHDVGADAAFRGYFSDPGTLAAPAHGLQRGKNARRGKRRLLASHPRWAAHPHCVAVAAA